MNIGINGFGRVGRCAFRAALSLGVPIAAVNGTAPPETLAHLLKYDSSYGTLAQDVRIENGQLVVGSQRVTIFQQRDPAQIPWNTAGVDVVLECTGEFTDREDAEKHLIGGAKKVLIAAPAKGEDITIVLGVNEHQYDVHKHKIISNASCTTNCLAPVAKVLDEQLQILGGFMSTIHAYTGDQRLLDGTHADLRRGRSAPESLVPTSTGAAKALHLVLPRLKGKLNGFAIRAPTPVVSLVDLTVRVGKQTTAEEVNAFFTEASKGDLKGILSVSTSPLVSIDYKGNPHSAIVDALSTQVQGDLVKVLAWYDNEWAYSVRLIELAKFISR